MDRKQTKEKLSNGKLPLDKNGHTTEKHIIELVELAVSRLREKAAHVERKLFQSAIN